MTNQNSPTAAANTKPEKAEGAEKNRYKATLNLPATPFAMKANLVQNEPASLKRWQAMGLYEKVRTARTGKPKFVFHDGPPYANGSIHLGHLMNKCLKDFVVRSKTMMGLDCAYIPGWDCHGLPIEHKVMTELQDAGKLAKIMGLEEGTRKMAVRNECKKYAEKFHKLHTGQMQRLLTLADYEHPYLTMQPQYEAAVLEVLAGLAEQGLVYRAVKPVHWSVANETALAEAELEYYDREDTSVYVDFEALDAAKVYDAFGLKENAEDADDSEESDTAEQNGEPESAKNAAPKPGDRPHQRPCFMIWTTTPWTLPANVAVAVHAKIEYALVWVDGNVTVIAANLVDKVTKMAGAESVVVLATALGEKLVGLRYRHPFVTDVPKCALQRACAIEGVWSIVTADYVTIEDGTGMVHTAPGHGTEDYQTGLKHNLPVYCPVRGDGTYDKTVPTWLQGLDIWKANDLVVKHLRDSGHLFHDQKFMHSYPHDWRSKTPVIFRCTEQWFVGVDDKFKHTNDPVGLEPKSLKDRSLNSVGFDPEHPITDEQREVVRQVQREQLEAYLEARHNEERGRPAFKPLTPHELSELDTKFGPMLKWVGRDGIEFVPEWGRNRMRGMLESRPDWCISRQRAWGLPIPAFLFKTDDGLEWALMTSSSIRAVAKIIDKKGADAWFSLKPSELLADWVPSENDKQDAIVVQWLNSKACGTVDTDFRKGPDILDVWFESGSSWNAVMRQRGLAFQKPDFSDRVDLYLEGSDQHRGWFQLSLLPALGYMGVPPFKTLLTHGFMVDRDGKKLSKSRADAARYEVDNLFVEFGVDVMRWWVSSLVYENDVKVDLELFALAGESYRKVRNTLRFMLSNLGDYEAPASAQQPSANTLDAWVLAEFAKVTDIVTKAYNAYDFQTVHKTLFDFCNETLSAVYLAAVKDRLYCDAKSAPRRRATQATLFTITDGLCKLLAPILCHTADEAYRALHVKPGVSDATTCVHLMEFPTLLNAAADPDWEHVLVAVQQAAKELELAKQSRGIENPLDAGVVLPDNVTTGSTFTPNSTMSKFDRVDLADLIGVSEVTIDTTAQLPRVVDLRSRPKCERSWKRDGTVKQRSDGGLLSDRDAIAVGV